jgi:hypothetical protein
MGPPEYYCIRPRLPSGTGWEAYTSSDADGGDCRPGLDKVDPDQPASAVCSGNCKSLAELATRFMSSALVSNSDFA